MKKLKTFLFTKFYDTTGRLAFLFIIPPPTVVAGGIIFYC